MIHPLSTTRDTVNPTGRLFFLKEYFSVAQQNHLPEHAYLIITDKDEDLSFMRKFAYTILGMHIHRIENMSELWSLSIEARKIYCISSHLLEHIGNIDYIKRQTVYELKRNAEIKIDDCIEKLIQFWYNHSDYRGEIGTYKREWSIISVTAKSGNLIQIEWFDTQIDAIIETSTHDGKRTFREKITLDNLREENTQIERKIGVLNESILTHITSLFDTILLFGCDFLPYIDELRKFASIHCTDFYRENSSSFAVSIPKINHIDEFLNYLWEIHKEPSWVKNQIIIYTKFEKSVRDFLEFHTLNHVDIIPLHTSGMESIELENKTWKTSIITDDIIGNIFVRTRSRKSLAKNLDLLISLKPGDYVVHREHWIARFDSVVKKTLWKSDTLIQETSQKLWTNIREVSREYLELHYAEGDKLFVPLTEIYRVSKYLGELEPELTRLSGKEWEHALKKADEEIEAIAADIIETTARRSLARGRAFGIFRKEEQLFQEAFAYEYTSDQKQSIDEVFADMEKDEPMDRLLSGDVGFGKTEVAMNAIYKAILSGTQVAVISPLLVLADEHYETFLDRLGPFSVRVGILTRMNSEKEVRSTLENLRKWTIDVLVGTHRLLSDDIVWKKLGLLIIDEEHKFWVTHKEKIKKLRAGIDILSLSATPIPRSLNLALSGLRKISLLTTPPKKKKAIRTIISKWHEPTLKHAIELELERGGQVIILHNRIRGMESIEKEIQNIVKSGEWKVKKTTKSPSIIITHGQMPGEQIEDRIHAFKKREYDILLTTTIIENGVNFLSANTIIILDPEDFWLASLHQLRGRVGRKDTEGFCYLIYRKPELGKDEKERLVTIANNSHLWAGFEIAMRDLEIRWAWDVLGIKQSWKSKDIGLTLYFRMLEEKIETIKNEKHARIPVKIELDLSYTLDDALFLSEQDKLQFFRDIENIEDRQELEEIQNEMNGKKWDEENEWLTNLFLLLSCRLILSEYGVKKLSKNWVNYVFDFVDDIDPTRVKAFLNRFDTQKSMVLLSLKKIRVEICHWKSIEEFLGEIVR